MDSILLLFIRSGMVASDCEQCGPLSDKICDACKEYQTCLGGLIKVSFSASPGDDIWQRLSVMVQRDRWFCLVAP